MLPRLRIPAKNLITRATLRARLGDDPILGRTPRKFRRGPLLGRLRWRLTDFAGLPVVATVVQVSAT